MQKNVGHKWVISHTVWKALRGVTNVSKASVISVRHSLWNSPAESALGLLKEQKTGLFFTNTIYATNFNYQQFPVYIYALQIKPQIKYIVL